jgi:hypothetical protein
MPWACYYRADVRVEFCAKLAPVDLSYGDLGPGLLPLLGSIPYPFQGPLAP